MNEVRFLHKNIRKWEEFESLLDNKIVSDPDNMSDLYIRLTDDLAYARTFLPESKVVTYLNSLTHKAHRVIYQNRPMHRNRILNFWAKEFPILVYSSRRQMSISLLIFIVAMLIGILSNQFDNGFSRIIMGDSYINMTLANIEKGDPMAVYKSMNQVEMFLGISINNIKVSFMAFVFGLFSAFGSGFIILKNGIMLGTFQSFLAQHGLMLESTATIWVHGTLEIFSIIVAGGAGIVLGNSFVFPGTFSRAQSFRLGSIKGAKLVLGLVPIFIVAGFLEGFVTRYTEIPYFIRFSIIGASLTFIVLYFIIYPRKLIKSFNYHGKHTD